jgi:hypothetical protein
MYIKEYHPACIYNYISLAYSLRKEQGRKETYYYAAAKHTPKNKNAAPK